MAANFAAMAISLSFLPLWFADHGLAAGQIGLVLGLSQLCRVLVIPVLGRAADAAGHCRLALAVAALVASAASLLLPGMPMTAPLFAAACVGSVASAALVPLADAVALPLASAGRLDYGRTRAWGSVSYMLAAASGGMLIGRAGSTALPPLLAGIYGLSMIAGLAMPEAPRTAAAKHERFSPFRQSQFRLVLLASALIQGAHASYYSFAALRWRSAGIGDGVVGLLIAEGVVAEVALFIWGRRLIERVGPGRLTMASALFSTVRWAALAVVVDPWLLACLQVLHAGTFALQHLSAMLVLRQVGAGRVATAQTWYSALGGALPGAALTWLSGRLYGDSPPYAFAAMAVVAFLALPVGIMLRKSARDPAKAALG